VRKSGCAPALVLQLVADFIITVQYYYCICVVYTISSRVLTVIRSIVDERTQKKGRAARRVKMKLRHWSLSQITPASSISNLLHRRLRFRDDV
jgi:hypothetical protein